MRRRELIRKLREIHAKPWRAPWFPTRGDVRNLAQEDTARLHELDALLPEIIEKLATE